MFRSAPVCPQCESRSTRWLPATSDGGFVDYFRCDQCSAVWVVGDATEPTDDGASSKSGRSRSGLMFLYVDIEAGLLFARMATATEDAGRRQQLRQKCQTAFDAVQRFLPRTAMSDDERAKVVRGLNALSDAIRAIPA